MLIRLSTLVKQHAIVIFFGLAFAFTWANWVTRALASRHLVTVSIPEFVTIVAGYGPALAAIIVTAVVHSRPGLRQLFGRLVRWRVGVRWYAFALLAPPAIALVAIGVHLLTGGTSPVGTQAAV